MEINYIENIREKMQLEKKKQKDLAKYLNVKPTTISKYFNGTRKITIDDLVKICYFLNTTPNEILDFE